MRFVALLKTRFVVDSSVSAAVAPDQGGLRPPMKSHGAPRASSTGFTSLAASDGWLASVLGGLRRERERRDTDSEGSPDSSGERSFCGTKWVARPGKPQRRPLHPLRPPPPPQWEEPPPPNPLPDLRAIATNSSTALDNFLRTAVDEATRVLKELVPISERSNNDEGVGGEQDNAVKPKAGIATLLGCGSQLRRRARPGMRSGGHHRCHRGGSATGLNPHSGVQRPTQMPSPAT